MWPAWRGVRGLFADPAGLIVALERMDPTLLSKAEAARVELCVADHGHNKENAAQVDVLAAGLATLKKRAGGALAAMAYLAQRLRAVLAEYHDFHRQRLLAASTRACYAVRLSHACKSVRGSFVWSVVANLGTHACFMTTRIGVTDALSYNFHFVHLGHKFNQ